MAILIKNWFFLSFLLLGPLCVIAQPNNPPTILNVIEDDRIATISWNSLSETYNYPYDNFKNQGSMSYKVEWGKVTEGFTNVLHTPYRIIQVQPLDPGELYQARIIAIDEYGMVSVPSSTVQFQHDPTRVNAMSTQLNGFFDDFNQPMGAFDELKWNQAYSGCAKIGYGSQHINDQFHAHNVLASDECDRGAASSRAREIFDFTNRTGRIEFDLDGAKSWRQRWYLDISPASRKRDLTGLVELDSYDISEANLTTAKQTDPPFLLRVNEIGDNVFIQMVSPSGVLVDLPNMFNNGACGETMEYCQNENMVPIPNVRRHWVIELSKTHIKVFIDDKLIVDGSLVNSMCPNGLPYETAQINWLWFSYNTTKENLPLSMVHWDNFGFDAPAGWAPSTVIHNYTDGVLGTDTESVTNDFSHGLMSTNTVPAQITIPIPDQIADINGNMPIKAELMFCIQGGDYSWNSNDLVSINGNNYAFAMPQSDIANYPLSELISTNRPYSAIIDIDPSDLTLGSNLIEFYLNNPKLLNIHIELTYPSNTAPNYTQPIVVHSDHMARLMNFSQFNNIGANVYIEDINATYLWDGSEYISGYDNVKQIRYREKQTPVSGDLSFDVFIYSDGQLTANAMATGFTHYEVWIDEKVYRTVSLAAEDYPSYIVHEDIILNTLSLSNGTHELFVMAYDIYGRPSVFDLFESNVAFGEYYPVRFTVNNPSTNSCITSLTDSDLGGGGANPIESGSHFVSNTITSSGLIEIANSVTYSAGNVVELSTGFEVEKGGFFLATTEGCFE